VTMQHITHSIIKMHVHDVEEQNKLISIFLLSYGSNCLGFVKAKPAS